MNRFEEAVAFALNTHFAPGSKPLLLAALSGGADSSAMTAALAALRDNLPSVPEFHCLHVNHGLRSPEACAADAEASAALCGKLGFPLSVKTLKPGMVRDYAKKQGTGIEGAARHFRHAFFRAEKKRLGAACILIAHTRDDLLETILMAVLRGAGSAGLSGMRPRTGAILRPLLFLSRRDVLGYLERRGLGYRTDESNADTRYLRNRVRHSLVPLLNASFPHWEEPLIRLWETQGLTADFLAREAAARLPWSRGENSLFTGAPAFFAQEEIIREEALFGALDAGIPQALNKKAAKIRRAALRPFARGEVSALDLGQLRLENRDGKITLTASGKAVYEESFSVLIKRPGVYKLASSKLFSPEKGELIVSLTGEGDSFFAGFPLVLRKEKAKRIAALDGKGLAALLREDGSIFWKRTPGTDTTGAYFAVK
jgi:tRNA(Ile)-lysidine synthase